VRKLGPAFATYARALEQKGEVDGTFLDALPEKDMELMFALVPKEHQTMLHPIFCGENIEEDASDDNNVSAFV
jgi:hypothetical protein